MTPSPGVARLVQIVFVAACGVGWYGVTANGLVNPILLPPFHTTMDELWMLLSSGAFWPDLAVTMYEWAVGFGLAAGAGLLTGYLVSRSRFSIQVFDPLFSGLYSIPTILLFPLFVLFFGLGPGSKIAMGATIAFLPITLTTMAGLGNVERGLTTAARSMGASDAQMFFFVLVPAAFPVVISGLRLGLILALLAILGVETIASLSGLGHQIVNASDMMDMPKMFAYTVLVLAVATLMNGIVTAIEKRVQEKIR